MITDEQKNRMLDDGVRNNLRDAEHWIEQARQSYFNKPMDVKHFRRSIKAASKYINLCRLNQPIK